MHCHHPTIALPPPHHYTAPKHQAAPSCPPRHALPCICGALPQHNHAHCHHTATRPLWPTACTSLARCWGTANALPMHCQHVANATHQLPMHPLPLSHFGVSPPAEGGFGLPGGGNLGGHARRLKCAWKLPGGHLIRAWGCLPGGGNLVGKPGGLGT